MSRYDYTEQEATAAFGQEFSKVSIVIPIVDLKSKGA
jgi:hypothetical protein